MKVLEVKNLKTYFRTDEGTAKAVDGISFFLNKGETLGIVGESGCGKSVTALSILRLLPKGINCEVNGEIIFNNKNLVSIDEKEMRKIRGNRISMIFQEPMTSLNPAYTCGNQVAEVLKIHKNISGKQAEEYTIELFKKSGIAYPEQRIKEYPHQLSGGMRQRVMIAIALACSPDILIADEPTTALDVTVQAQILDLIKDIQRGNNMSVILITHDLGVVSGVCGRIIVMYASKIVETGTVDEIFNNPKHPYTIGLLNSIPKSKNKSVRLSSIPGNVPSSVDYPPGCRFSTRCSLADEKCTVQIPPDIEISETHYASCLKI
jgi:oligopeptide/dipeptide ABC transporter ATP-binding protein